MLKCLNLKLNGVKKNDCAMPEEFRKGFIAGLNQAVFLINAVMQRMVWTDGEIVDDEDLLTRAAEHRNEAVAVGQTCPACKGEGIQQEGVHSHTCVWCDGTGHV